MEMETKIKVEYDNEDWGQWYIVDGVKFTFGWNDSVAEYEMRIKAQSYADFLNGHSQHSESLNKLKEALDALEQIANGTEPATDREAWIWKEVAKQTAQEALNSIQQ